MSKLRTQEERRAIIKKCLEIEAAGGDVIAYLLSQHYVSAKATWYNMQRYDLKRPDSQITSGRPTEHTKSIRRDRITVAEMVLTDIEAGKKPTDTFLQMGYANPGQSWMDLKTWLKKHRPDLYDRIPAEYIGRGKAWKPTEECKIGIPKKPKEEPKPQPIPKPGESVTKYRFIPLKELKRRLQAELAKAAQTDVARACEITDDLRAIERVRQLGQQALKERPA